MDKDQIQSRLIDLYRQWKADFNSEALDTKKFGPPLLLTVTEDYYRAATKVIVYGQETRGWDWRSTLQVCYPRYPNRYLYNDQVTLQDFLMNRDAIEALCWGYKEFEFSKYQEKNFNSPFWQAFRKIQKWWPNAGVLYSNLVHVDYACQNPKHDHRSFLCACEKSKTSFVEQQRSLLCGELKILQPDICIFLTGPKYDWILESTFPGISYQKISANISERELAKTVHDDLPQHSYRTYHPGSLMRAKKQNYLNVIKSFAIT